MKSEIIVFLEKLKDEYPDKETRSKVIGAMETEVKKDKKGI